MKQFLIVFLGGGIGSVLRYWISKSLNPYFSNFFLGTFTVNVLGCLLIGFIMGLSLKTNILSPTQILLLVTGFCGGFTTFSAFAMESQLLLKDSNLPYFAFYTVLSIALGVVSISIGLWISKLL